MPGQQRLGLRIRQLLIGLEFAPARAGELSDPAARVLGMRHGPDEALFLQAAQQTAGQPGVEPEIVPQLRDLTAALPDRIEHARRAKWPPAAQERSIERADLGGDGAVEAANA